MAKTVSLDGKPGRNDLCACSSGKKYKHCCLRSAVVSGSGPRSTAQLLQQALLLQQQGRLDEAGSLYGEILRLEPRHSQALHFTGLVAHQRGQQAAALHFMSLAIVEDPSNPTFFLNLAEVQIAQGATGEAIANFHKAAELDPRSPAAWSGLGHALLRQGRLVEAASALSKALSLSPESPEIVNSLGTVLQRLGRLEQAAVCYRKAIALRPAYAEAHNNLGNALELLGRLSEGIVSYRQALLLNPAYAAAHCNLGNALRADGRLDEAIESCERAIALQPELAEAHLNLGNAYRQQGLLDRAVSCYERGISVDAAYAPTYNNLAETLRELGNLQKARETFETALSLRPDFSTAFSNLLYLHAFTRDVSPAVELELARRWERTLLTDAERAAARARSGAAAGVFPALGRTGRKLRIGIVSAELGSHAVAQFLEPFIEQLDRSRFRLTLFPTAERCCQRAAHLRELADDYVPLVRVPDAEAAERIRSEQIDVLIDTTGHTFGCRLGIFAHRAAPVQCTYIGYWSTTGLTEMDWFLTDLYCPAACDAHFSEGLWRLPRLALCYAGDASLPESGWSPDPEGTLWLGSFNKYAKVREETLGLWARVLLALPEARLLLEDRAANEQENHSRILRTLGMHGVAADRVEFVPFSPGHERHMMLYDRLDIALDTIPFNSGTTCFDALWMGVPLVALEGNWVGGVIASSALRALGREDWVAATDEQYVSVVCSLARDVAGRTASRRTQRARMSASPLCDAKTLTRSLEDGFEAMYDRWLICGART
ncbi:MAG TPA: tetratricopeptide repeat protein [Acidisarcina sp.]